MENNTNPKDHGILKKVLFFLKFLEIRLRFVLILVVTALVVGYWDNIQNYIERWQRNSAASHVGHDQGAAESEFEYYCAMHPFVVRDRPGKCPICGMDLVQRKKGAPVTLPAGTLARVQVSPDRVMQAGIQVEPVAYRLLTRTVRSYGVIEPDETRLAKIIARFPGRIDKLMVNAVGMTVKKGEPLAQIYSPKFLAATQEYVQALKAEQRSPGGEEKRRAAQLSEYARQRLLLAGFTEEQIKGISADGKLNDSVELQSPLAGTVLEKNALLGEAVEEGSALYTIADLSKVWVQALVIESDLSAIKAGMPVEVSSVSYPGEIFFGTVDFIYPTLNPENRSVKVRVVVDNAAGKLKPGMYVTAVMRSPLGRYGAADSFGKDDQSQPEAAHAGHPGMAMPTGAAQPVKLPTQTQADADRFLAGLPAGAEYYTCSMDPEVVSNKPGDCPKCGMHLEKRRKEAVAKEPAGHAEHAQTAQATQPAPAADVKLPTQDQAAADKYLQTLAPGAPYYACPMHPEVVSDKPGDCPKCGMHLEQKTKAADSGHQDHQPAGATHDAAQPSTQQWAEGYSCAMHPDELNDKPGVCTVCGCGMKLEKVRVERVLSIPEMAVIDTGTKYVVYVESSPGVYDSRAVKLGPRAGEYYPVLDGLKLGDRIVSRGSFLIDAEARLNPTAVAPGEGQAGGSGHQHGG